MTDDTARDVYPLGLTTSEQDRATAIDEAIIQSTADALAGGGAANAALMHEERSRTRRIAPLMIGMAIVTSACLPLFSGTPWARWLLQATIGLGVASMSWLWWVAAKAPQMQRWQLSLAWGLAFPATCANTIYFGIYSPAPVLMTLAIIIFAQGHSPLLARGAYVFAAVTQATFAILDGVGVVPDPGIVQSTSLTTLDRIAGQFLIHALLFTAYLMGRSARKSSAEAIALVREAMREVAKRDVIANEVRDDARRALNIGGAGRLSGETVGDFRLGEVIGQGGMGEVYRGVIHETGAEAAVKVIHPYLCSDEDALKRFLREGRLAASLDSPHIVTVLGLGHPASGPYLAMELLHGYSLTAHLQQHGSLAQPQLEALAVQTGAGLDAARNANIVHRDIKPQNLFLIGKTPMNETEALQIKILDFGVARIISGQDALTQEGLMIGTPAYMAPEQITGEFVDHRADLHALTALLYRCATGFPPFAGPTPEAVIFSVVNDRPRVPSLRAGLPKGLDAFFAKGFAKNPNDRYQSGEELATEFARACQGWEKERRSRSFMEPPDKTEGRTLVSRKPSA